MHDSSYVIMYMTKTSRYHTIELMRADPSWTWDSSYHYSLGSHEVAGSVLCIWVHHTMKPVDLHLTGRSHVRRSEKMREGYA